MAESEEELKSLLMRTKEESEKAGLKLNIKEKKNRIIAPSPITSWQIEGRKVQVVTDFISWVPKSLQIVTAIMKLKRLFFLGWKAMTKLETILKTKTSLC